MKSRMLVLASLALALILLGWLGWGRISDVARIESLSGREDGGPVHSSDVETSSGGLAGPHLAGAQERESAPAARLDLTMPLVEQSPTLESALSAGDGSAAFALAQGWWRCRFFRRVSSDQELADSAARHSRFRFDMAEAILAEVPDDEVVESAVERLSEIDPAQMVQEELATMRRQRDFCAGTESLQSDARRLRVVEFLRRGAELGDRSSRRAFTVTAFQPIITGVNIVADIEAVRFAELKPVVQNVVDQGLAAGDPYMLGEQAVFTAEGYFAPPDPVLGYAYSQAYLSLVDQAMVASWQVDGLDLRQHRQLVRLDASLAQRLDVAQRQRAGAVAEHLKACCNGEARP